MAIPQDMRKTMEDFKREFRGNKLEAIKASNGGSLMDIFGKVEASQTPTLIIGLGGIGCKTLNAIKHKYIVSIKDGDLNGAGKHIHFLAVDTDYQNTLKHLLKERPGGWLEEDEIHSLIRRSANLLFKFLTQPDGTLPEQKWVDHQLNRNKMFDDSGAGGVRQIGRVGLSDNENYDALRQKLTEVIQKMNAGLGAADGVKIVITLIAGISGGTGSGTIMDVSYLIQDVAAHLTGRQVQLDAILYTPEVQIQNPAISDKNSLKRNFTAAMKEIDTFFKASETGAEYTFQRAANPEGTYDIATAIGETVSRSDMFSSCTLVQGYDSLGNLLPNAEEVAMETVANYVISMIADYNVLKSTANAVAQPSMIQTVQAVLCNEANFTLGKTETLQQNRPSLPRDYKYNYRAIGFRSLNYPVGELMTYLANQMTRALCTEFDKQPKYSAEEIMVNRLHLIPDDFYNQPQNKHYALDEVFELGRNHEIQESFYPEFSYGDLRKAKQVEELGITSSVYDEEWINGMSLALIQYVKQELSYKTDGTGGNGPFAAVRLSKHMDDILTAMLSACEDKSVEDYYKTQKNESMSELRSMLSEIHDRFPGVGKLGADSIVEDFRAEFQNYLIWNWKCENLTKAYNAVVAVKNSVVSENHRTWNFAVGAFLAIADIMENDSTAALDAKIHVDDNITVFSKDVLNVQELEDDTSNLALLMNQYLDAARIQTLCEDLTQDMLNPDNLEAWTSTQTDAFDVVKRVRDVFTKQFSAFAKEQLEKLLVVKYAQLTPNFKLKNLLTFMNQYLDPPGAAAGDKWDNFENACIAAGIPSPLLTAATAIYNDALQFKRCAAMDPGVTGIADFNNLFVDKRLCLNENTPHINRKISAMADANVQVGEGSFPGVTYSEVACGAPLYFFRDMIEWQEQYTKALHSPASNPGMHMDASAKTGWAKFPPLISNDTLRLRDPQNLVKVKNRQDYQDEQEILMNIKKEADFGLEDAVGMFTLYQDPNTATKYYILRTLSDALVNQMEQNADLLQSKYQAVLNRVENDVRTAIANMPPVAPNDGESFTNAWERVFSETYHLPPLVQLLEDVGCQMMDLPLNITLACPLMDMTSTDSVDESNEGGFYKTIRASATFRRKLDQIYNSVEPLKPLVDQKKREICVPELKKQEIQEKKSKEKKFIKFLVEAVLTKHLLIEYDPMTYFLTVTYYYTRDDFHLIYHEKLIENNDKKYYAYSAYTEFLNWANSLSSTQLDQIKNDVNSEFVNIWNPQFKQKIAPDLVRVLVSEFNEDTSEFNNMNVGLPGIPQIRKCQTLDEEYKANHGRALGHLLDSYLYEDVNLGNNGYGARVIGYYTCVTAEIVNRHINVNP